MRILASILLLAAAGPSLVAQRAIYPVREVAVSFDSGLVDNPAATARVVWSQDVAITGDWMQLHFAEASLPGDTRLRVFAPGRPEWVQWHDGSSVVDYRGYSCQFAGSTLRVELLAAAGSFGNRVRIDRAIGFDVGSTIGVDTICGPTDDRVLSSDPRACRINASCTAWLFGLYAVGTAGHCMTTTAGQILHFNVPLSNGAGTPQPAHPNDQYAMESFHPFLNAGVGQDWSVSVAVRNSNTQRFPGEAQGGWYNVTPAPAFAGGQNIRVTGYGTGNGTSGSPTWNQVQKTHLGGRQSTGTATALRYGTDTTGGNSGSPVLLEATGDVIGVHTHGGCTSTGGGNSGTDAVRSDFTAARAQALTLHNPGALVPFGVGCGGAAGVPRLSFQGQPNIGTPLIANVNGLLATVGVPGFLAGGASDADWGGVPLPLALDAFGIEGCQLFVSVDQTDSVFGSLGTAQRLYAIPADQALVGVHFYFQFFGFDATAPNSLGMVSSNAVAVQFGS